MEQFAEKRIIDSRGRPCPGPVTDLSKAYRVAKLGDVLEVWATDPAAKNEIQTWAKHSGNDILEIADEKNYARIVVQVTKKRT